jgi:hypothetical protein
VQNNTSGVRIAIRCALVGAVTGALLTGTAQQALALPTSSTVSASGALAQGVETLTMDKITRMYQAIVNVAIASKNHPELEDVLSLDADDSQAQATAKIAAVPAAVDAIKRAGLTTPEYVRLSLTVAATAIGETMLKTDPSAKLPDGVSLANVHFMEQHAADIEAVQKRLAAQMAAAGVGQ